MAHSKNALIVSAVGGSSLLLALELSVPELLVVFTLFLVRAVGDEVGVAA